jgi:hypothetical protein
MSVRRDREVARGDHTSSVVSGMRRRDEYSWDSPSGAVEIPVQAPSAPAPLEDSQTRLQKLIDQGYSAEVAQVIVENEDNQNR